MTTARKPTRRRRKKTVVLWATKMERAYPIRITRSEPMVQPNYSTLFLGRRSTEWRLVSKRTKRPLKVVAFICTRGWRMAGLPGLRPRKPTKLTVMVTR